MIRNLLCIIILFISATTCKAVAGKTHVDPLPKTAEVIPNFSINDFEQKISDMPLHRIEGIWRFTTDGVTIAIIRLHDSECDVNPYNIILLSSPNRALRPGTVLGRVWSSAEEEAYEAYIYTKTIGITPMMPKKFTLFLADNDRRLQFRQHRSAYSLNLWRFVPYLWRYSIRKNDERQTISGCIRVFPEPEPPIEPRYL